MLWLWTGYFQLPTKPSYGSMKLIWSHLACTWTLRTFITCKRYSKCEKKGQRKERENILWVLTCCIMCTRYCTRIDYTHYTIIMRELRLLGLMAWMRMWREKASGQLHVYTRLLRENREREDTTFTLSARFHWFSILLYWTLV